MAKEKKKPLCLKCKANEEIGFVPLVGGGSAHVRYCKTCLPEGIEVHPAHEEQLKAAAAAAAKPEGKKP